MRRHKEDDVTRVMKAVKDLERVVETAVERNSWGKSRGGQMCRFPNTGGLHHTPGNAPLDTRIMSNNGEKHGVHPVTKLPSSKLLITPGTTIVMSNNRDTVGRQPPWCHCNKSRFYCDQHRLGHNGS